MLHVSHVLAVLVMLFMGLVFAAGPLAVPAAADIRHGLDQRPANPSCAAPNLPLRNINIKTAPAFGGARFTRPVSLQQVPGSSRFFVGEREGLIRTFTLAATPTVTTALDLTQHMAFTSLTDVSDSQQAGITAIALHPNFNANGYIYVAYNRKPTATSRVFSYLSRFTANAGRTAFLPGSEKILLTLEQTAVWHHIGQIIFDREGYLMVGLGDGANILPDQRAFRAQNPFSLYGKILRIDVDTGNPYGIPPSNPFADGVGGAPEVYAMGFRNPWRFTVDRETGDIWAGDVGQATWEEVNRVVKGGNYGWPYFEGPKCTQPSCSTVGLIPPVHAFTHADGPAVMGGYVYRGRIVPLRGVYVFGVAGITTLRGLIPEQGYARLDLATVPSTWLPHGFNEDNIGELYVLNGQQAGAIYKIVPNTDPSPGPVANVAGRLSQTGCVDPANPRRFAAGVVPFDVNMPLWSDGTEKVRGIALPDGEAIDVRADGSFDPPEGTVLLKMFVLDGKPVETRLFMRHPGGAWLGYSYEWRADLSDADLLPGGKIKPILRPNGNKLRYVYPSREQCLVCHNPTAGFVLGVQTAQLNREIFYPSTGRTSNQLATWQHVGLFSQALPPFADLPALAGRTHGWVSPIRRARDHLHANCAFCHLPGGVAQANLDLRSGIRTADMRACNQPPLSSDLGVPGAVLLAPGDPSLSLISLRMRTRNANAMPPLGSTRVDALMANVVDAWIRRADVCGTAADWDGDGIPDDQDDSDGDGIVDAVDNCRLHANADQADANKDGYGNRCDGDFNADLVANATDRAGLRTKALKNWKRNQSGYTPQHDLNHDLIIDARDLAIFDQELVGRRPGPSALKP